MKTNLLILSMLLLISCDVFNFGQIKKKNLFSLQIGKMEDEINLFESMENQATKKNRVVMKDGIFYIANGNAAKVMEFTSFGDILSLYYNKDVNPAPVLLANASDESVISNRRAFPINLNDVGEVAIGKDKTLLIDDRVNPDRYVFSKELYTQFDRVILRINNEGKLLDYIGQEGRGGTPFPYIERIAVTARNEIVVICKTMKSWNIFWYLWEGKLYRKIEIPYNELPKPKEEKIISSLETIYPDTFKRRIYLKIDYYKQIFESSGKNQMDIKYDKSSVYWIDIDNGEYVGYVDVPEAYVEESKGSIFEKEKVEVVYEFLGVSNGSNLFFLSPSNNDNYQVLILDLRGNIIGRKDIELKDSEVFYSGFYLSSEGILCAMLINKYACDIVWWRTDNLLKDFIRENS